MQLDLFEFCYISCVHAIRILVLVYYIAKKTQTKNHSSNYIGGGRMDVIIYDDMIVGITSRYQPSQSVPITTESCKFDFIRGNVMIRFPHVASYNQC